MTSFFKVPTCSKEPKWRKQLLTEFEIILTAYKIHVDRRRHRWFVGYKEQKQAFLNFKQSLAKRETEQDPRKNNEA